VGVLAPGRALGADADKAEELIRRANEHRKRGNEDKALPLLQEAYKLSRSPRASAQLGLCHQGLGQWAEAELRLTEALEASNDPWVKKNEGVLRNALTTVKNHVGRVEIVGEPAGADVLVNGAVVGKLPLASAVPVAAGEVLVEVRAPGHTAATKSFRLDGGQYQKLVLRLAREGAPSPDQAAATGAPTSPAPSPLAPPPGAPAPTADPPQPQIDAPPPPTVSPARRAAKWIAWGAAAVGLGVGVFGLARNRSVVSDFDAGCGVDENGVARADGMGRTDAQCADLKGSYETAGTVGLVGFISAVVLGGAGVALWATEPRQPEAPRTTAFASCAPHLGPGLTALGCSISF
jgi:hypothetical protein